MNRILATLKILPLLLVGIAFAGPHHHPNPLTLNVGNTSIFTDIDPATCFDAGCPDCVEFQSMAAL